MNTISRRAILRGAALTATTAPLVRLQGLIDTWESHHFHKDPSSDLIKLNSNENPYGPSDRARAALIAAIDQGNRYPRPAISKLRSAVARYEGVSEDQVLITAGSTEILGVVGLMTGLKGGRVIGCDPTFDFTLYFAQHLGAEWIKVPLAEDHQYNLRGINAKMTRDTTMVYVCNPNNPTGAALPPAMLHPFCKTLAQRCTVFVDEAYIEFTEEGIKGSLASATKERPNLIVARTFSKIYGLAGLRIGYAIAHPDTIRTLRNFLEGRNITASVCSTAAAQASIGDKAFIEYCLGMNEKSKSITCTAFDKWGVEYVPSSTNFIFFRTDRFATTRLVPELQRRNILIRSYGHVPGWARVSMGTPDEMKVFVNEIESLLV